MLNLNTTRIYVHNLPRRAKYMNGKVSINKKKCTYRNRWGKSIACKHI